MKTIKAKTKLDALKQFYHNIYWKGNTPYAYIYAIYSYQVFAIKIAKGEYYLYKKQLN